MTQTISLSKRQALLNEALFSTLLNETGPKRISLCQKLLKKGADICWSRNSRTTLFHMALHFGDEDLSHLFIETLKKQKKEDISYCLNLNEDTNKDNVVFTLIRYGHYHTAIQLIGFKELDVTYKNSLGETLLQVCNTVESTYFFHKNALQIKKALQSVRKALSERGLIQKKEEISEARDMYLGGLNYNTPSYMPIIGQAHRYRE